ncbi:TSUP family transporter [Mycobacterium sp. NPDC004974]
MVHLCCDATAAVCDRYASIQRSLEWGRRVVCSHPPVHRSLNAALDLATGKGIGSLRPVAATRSSWRFSQRPTPKCEILASLRGKRALLALLAMGGIVGGLAARFAPAELGQWAFVAYLGITLMDAVVRPGFVRPVGVATQRRTIRAGYGLPVGAVAAFLGVGGSVLTVPLLRRAGHSMESATALANPMTLAITAPAVVPLIASVDVTSAAALLLGATPVVVVLRRYGITIPDIVHARAYVGLIGTVCVAMTLAALY